MKTPLDFFQWICRFNFGTFEKEEFKKFLRMGLIFIMIIGVYWTLRPLKDAIFIHLVDKLQLPFAKTVSVLALIPLVMFFTKLMSKYSRERMLKILPAFYGLSILVFSFIMFFAESSAEVIASRSMIPYIMTKLLGYFFYLFVESFGSLVVALFWAFSSDATDPTSAKRGFPLVYALGQMGGIIFPYSIASTPHWLGFSTDSFSLALLGIITLSIIPLVNYFLKATPKELLVPYQGKNQEEEKIQKKEVGFLEGLKMMLKYRYLLGIFAVNFIYEVIVTIFDFNFKISAGDHYSGVALSHYLSIYGSSVNIVSFLCLILGISNISRFLGVGVALVLMPIIVGFALFGFLSLDSLNFLFTLMVGSKAINYALNGPALKQLYIPTTHDVRYKALAWIETFGQRSSKEIGSLFNMLLAPLEKIFGKAVGKSYYLLMSGCLGFVLVGFWFIVALYLGRTFKKAIQEKKVIC